MPNLVPQAASSQPYSLSKAIASQLDLALDHPRPNGLLQSERRIAIAALARLMLESRSVVVTTTREDGDEQA